jgi:hypothetical protein
LRSENLTWFVEQSRKRSKLAIAFAANTEPINIPLKATGAEGRGYVVVRNLGLADALEISLFKLKPNTSYSVYIKGHKEPVAAFKTNLLGHDQRDGNRGRCAKCWLA